MKHPLPLPLVSSALALSLLAGCDAPRVPLATAPTAKAGVPANLPQKEDSFWREETKQRVVLEGPVVPASASEVVAEKPAAEAPAEKPKPTESAGTRPKADREPTKPGDPEKITFDDLIIGIPADTVFRPFMLSDRAKELEGKKVRLTGEMYGAVAGTEKLKEFIILRNKECKYGPGGAADHVADVKMKEGHTARYKGGTTRVEGTLRIAPLSGADGNTKHIYVLEDAVVK